MKASGKNNLVAAVCGYLLFSAGAAWSQMPFPATEGDPAPIEAVVPGTEDMLPVAMTGEAPLTGEIPIPVEEEAAAAPVALEGAAVPEEITVPADMTGAGAAASPVVTPATPAEITAAPPAELLPTAPTAAEMAIIQNTAVLDTMTPPSTAGATASGTGLRVTDILSQPADIRPWPEKYLVVRKDHAADDTDSRLTAARTALSRGHDQAAFELFDELYAKNPLDTRVAMGRAVALQKLGMTTDALAAYEVTLGRDPGNVEAMTNMLGLLKDDPEVALEKLSRLREAHPGRPDVAAQLGMLYGTAGDYANALKYLNMADALKPGNSVVLYNKAVVYDRMGQSVEAAGLYRQIIALAGEGALDRSFPIETVKKRLAVIR